MRKIIFLSLLICLLSKDIVHSADYTNKTVPDYKATIGSILACKTANSVRMPLNQINSQIYNWALSNGIIEESSITKQISYSDKITTKNEIGTKVLVIGCWITQKIVKETVGGREVAYAKGVFQVNDAIKQSPLMNTSVCKIKNKRSPTYGHFDYIFKEQTLTVCPNQNYILIPNISMIEDEPALFKLRKNNFGDKKGYLVSIGMF